MAAVACPHQALSVAHGHNWDDALAVHVHLAKGVLSLIVALQCDLTIHQAQKRQLGTRCIICSVFNRREKEHKEWH